MFTFCNTMACLNCTYYHILFRFMLKSLGLWKETSPDIELREDKEYDLQPDDIQNLVVGRRTEVGKKYIKLNDSSGP